MATLYITEFQTIGGIANFNAPIAAVPELANQTVSIGMTSAASSAFSGNTGIVRLHTDAICSIEFGTTPTATATTARMAANQTEYFAVPVGGAFKVAVITNS